MEIIENMENSADLWRAKSQIGSAGNAQRGENQSTSDWSENGPKNE
jgi:hypothetical protein